MKKMNVLIAALLVMTLTACNEKKSTEPAPTSETVEAPVVETVVSAQENLFGSWELIAIHTEETADKKVEELFPGKKPTLNFEGNLKVHGNDGCNNLTGEYEIKANNGIVIGDKLAATRMFCDGVSDFAFTKGLIEVTNYEITESALIFKKDDKIVMEFKQIKPETQEVK